MGHAVLSSFVHNACYACRTPSPAREPAAASAAPAAPAPPPSAPAAEEVKELSPDEIALRSKNLVEEYLTNKDPKELFLSIQVQTQDCVSGNADMHVHSSRS